MGKGIFLSINPDAARKIASHKKTCEFRNYLPREPFNMLYVYVTSPVCKLMYIVETGTVIAYPAPIDFAGDGNEEFNKGQKAKYAFPIERVYKLIEEIPLSQLREMYSFTPPQSYSYADTYHLLSHRITQAKKRLLWEQSVGKGTEK